MTLGEAVERLIRLRDGFGRAHFVFGDRDREAIAIAINEIDQSQYGEER